MVRANQDETSFSIFRDWNLCKTERVNERVAHPHSLKIENWSEGVTIPNTNVPLVKHKGNTGII